jgi:hypothetical protein
MFLWQRDKKPTPESLSIHPIAPRIDVDFATPLRHYLFFLETVARCLVNASRSTG